MSERSASLPDASGVATRPSALGAVAAALLASIIAGLTGLVLVFGRGLSEAPANTFVVAGLVYAAVPGIPALLAIRHLLRKSRAGIRRDLANYASLSATAALLWFLPLLGLFVPMNGTSILIASGVMALYHALSGAAGGLAFWLLTRQGRQT